MSLCYKMMTIEQVDAALALWKGTYGIGLSEADEKEAIERFLARNPGLSFACDDGGACVGTVLAGHDGRRGYLYHLAVAPSHRRQGIATRLLNLALSALQGEGIGKCHLFVFAQNKEGRAFWQNSGFELRDDLVVYSSSLVGADFVGADFVGADFVGADFVGADFVGADFVGADFVGADCAESLPHCDG